MNTRAPFDALTDIVNAQLPLEAQARYWDTVFTSLTDHVRREVPDDEPAAPRSRYDYECDRADMDRKAALEELT